MLSRKYSKNRPSDRAISGSTNKETETPGGVVPNNERRKNIHVSTSLPGPLAGYRRKRNQSVQAGDDSHFYNRTYHHGKSGRLAVPIHIIQDSDGEQEDDDEEVADYNENTPYRETLHDAVTISQQTTPIKPQSSSSTATPQQARAKIEASDFVRKSRTPKIDTSKSQQESQGLVASGGESGRHTPRKDGDEEEGFIDAVRDVFGGHFNEMQKRGDLENVLVKFAGNIVGQVGLNTSLQKEAEVPHEMAVEREQWDSKMDFLLSVVGFAVDLSAIWRFPAICFSNGGGAFLVPYLIMMVFCGLPLMYLEFCLGQFHRNGCITIWTKICPMFKGVGFAICIITSIIAMYYNTIMAWSLFMLLSSIASTVPWDSCDKEWNSENNCVTFQQRARLNQIISEFAKNCSNYTAQVSTPAMPSSNEQFLFLRSDVSSIAEGSGLSPSSSASDIDMSIICNQTNGTNATLAFAGQVSSAEEYFYRGVLELHKSHGFTDLGPIKWQTAMCLLGVFVIVYFALWKGVKSSGKAVWFTATFPYGVLLVLLFRVMTLPGSLTGVKYYVTPNLDALGDVHVWQEAAGQVLFQLGPGFGVLLALSSYNKFHNNCLADSLITTSISAFTSIMAGFVVFGTLGYIAGMVNKPIEELEAFGHGLIFVAYPEAIGTLPGAPIWAILFFAMLINLGLDTTFGGLESMITGLLDYLPVSLYKRREYFVLAMIVYIYFGALPTCTYGGILLFQFYDAYGVEIPLLLIAFLECVGVCWIYGIPQFSKDIAMMHGHEPSIIWKILWFFVCPFVVLFAFVAGCMRPKDTEYRGIQYPSWSIVLGWGLTCFSISCVPLYIIYLSITTRCDVEKLIGSKSWLLPLFKYGLRWTYRVGGGPSVQSSAPIISVGCPTVAVVSQNNAPATDRPPVYELASDAQQQPQASSSESKEKKATIVDMHYCDIDSLTPGNSPAATTERAIN